MTPKTVIRGLSRQLIHPCMHTSCDTLSLKIKMCVFHSNLSKMAVPKMNKEVDKTFTYQNSDKFIALKDKALYSIQNYLAKGIGCS